MPVLQYRFFHFFHLSLNTLVSIGRLLQVGKIIHISQGKLMVLNRKELWTVLNIKKQGTTLKPEIFIFKLCNSRKIWKISTFPGCFHDCPNISKHIPQPVQRVIRFAHPGFCFIDNTFQYYILFINNLYQTKYKSTPFLSY